MSLIKLKNNQGVYETLAPDYHITINQMPPVTSADNRKFARVVNGQWAAVEVPSAENSTVYTFDAYLMLGSSFSSLNDAVNIKCGTSGNHSLTELIAILNQANV